MYQFNQGSRFRWDGLVYEVTQRLADARVNLLALATGAVTTVVEHTLVAALFAGRLSFAIPDLSDSETDPVIQRTFVSLDDCSPHQQLVARYRYWVIEPLVATGREQRTRPVVQERVTVVHALLAQECVPVKLTYDGDEKRINTRVSATSIYRWLSAYEQSGGDIRSLIPNWHQSGRRNYLDESVDQIVTGVIEELHLRRERHGLDDLYLETRLRLKEANATETTEKPLAAPSRSTVHRRLRNPGHGDHRFRAMAITDSGGCRSPIPVMAIS